MEPTMTCEDLLGRITVDPKIFGGKPIIRGMRISVELILTLLAQGETTENILDDCPGLEIDDIRACLAYAHAVIADDRLGGGADRPGVRFLIDRCAGRRLAAWLGAEGHDVAEARQRGPDPGEATLPGWAAAENRVLITIDTDFGALVHLHVARHASLIRLPMSRRPHQLRSCAKSCKTARSGIWRHRW